MEREEELEQTIDELNYRLTNALKKIDRLKLSIKQAREEIDNLDYLINDAKYSDQETRVDNVDSLATKFYEIMDKLIENEETVSRQAVIAIANDSCLDLDSYEDTKEFCDAIRELPPVTPTHGTCKDCSHRDPEDKKCDCGHDIQWQLPREDNWYCADFKKVR